MAAEKKDQAVKDELQAVFQLFDKNGCARAAQRACPSCSWVCVCAWLRCCVSDGYIQRQELQTVLHMLGAKDISTEQLDAMIAKVDLNSECAAGGDDPCVCVCVHHVLCACVCCVHADDHQISVDEFVQMMTGSTGAILEPEDELRAAFEVRSARL